ncbi:hypothetical protein [Aliidiomarina taiwanensis]|nr:hypothetical protein [Aliidiomarina taiwanensis]
MQAHNSAQAELCNAMYERELALLSYADDDAARIRRKLRSLPFYVKKAAWWLIEADSPLTLDTQNAGWQAKQRPRPPQPDPTHLPKWLEQHIAPGLPLPVEVTAGGKVHIRLDSVDRVDYANKRFHLNRWGWCAFTGASLAKEPIRVLKPTVTVMTAACAGHRWNNAGRLPPVALPLRELLLSAMLCWPKFTQARRPDE